MFARSKQRNIIMTTRKLRRVMNEIRGKNVVEAYNMLTLMPYRAATVILKNLIAASHNAKQKYGVEPDTLKVSQVFADEGKTLARFKPRAQGRIFRREKRTSHLTLEVALDERKIKQSASA